MRANGFGWAGVAVVLILCLLVSPQRLAAAVIWSDGFESGNFSAWTSANGNWQVITSEQSAHSGLKGADIAGATAPNGDTLLLEISSIDYRNLEFWYWFKVRAALEAEDEVLAQWTDDGLNWQTLATYTNQPIGGWQPAFFGLPLEAGNNPDLGFRLLAKLGSSGDRMNFDDFVLQGELIPEPSAFGLLALGLLASARPRSR